MSLHTAEIAANRFGLGAKPGELSSAKTDPQGWLLEQLKPLTLTDDFNASRAAIFRVNEYRALQKAKKSNQRQAKSMTNKLMAETPSTMESTDPVKEFRKAATKKAKALAIETLVHQINTLDSFQGRLLDFFSNHFSVTANKFIMNALAPTLEREAIAPHLSGHFDELLIAVEQHPAMLVYLNNEQSIGPDSAIGRKRKKRGLNENLAREILELHTLGVDGGYSQEDIKELAKAISGWTVSHKTKDAGFVFRKATHQPGSRTVLGKNYKEGGITQGEKILRDLAVHPATAEFICLKLARHFIADTPHIALVNAMTKRWRETDGHLTEVLKVMVEHPHSWQTDLQKLKSPREFLISACRACGTQLLTSRQLFDSLLIMGQAPFSAGSPAGFGDTSQTWDGAEALMSRIEWADQFASQLVTPVDPIANLALGEHLQRDTLRIIQGAESRSQALALLLMSPEFQRR